MSEQSTARQIDDNTITVSRAEWDLMILEHSTREQELVRVRHQLMVVGEWVAAIRGLNEQFALRLEQLGKEGTT